jgi:antitoxin (DNA-binding transcriptional repressor) of toxin-antitoxin stability system
MLNQVLLETAEQNLKGLLAQLSLGETVTLADEDGNPLALLVSLKAESADLQLASEQSDFEWRAQMESLAEEVDAAWQGDKSALEELAEMRR